MKKRIKKIVNNQRGSALAFVLIVGMVLTILLGSLIALAERGIFKTQSSLESRQDYADAKSVIEYGKDYINQDIKEKFKSDNIYKPGDGDEPQGETIDNIEGDKIFYITGTRDNPSGPLKLLMTKGEPPENDTTVLGVCHFGWKKTIASGGAAEEQHSARTEYTYKILTKNMSRKMDFQTIFMYIVEEVKNGMALEHYGSGLLIEKDKYIIEKDPEIIKPIGPNKAEIDGSKMNLKLKSCKRDTGSDLTIKAENISGLSDVYNTAKGRVNIDAEETVFLKGDLILPARKKNDPDSTVTKIKGKNIVIRGNLNLLEYSKLEITAERLWVTGDINLNPNSNLVINCTEELITNEYRRKDATNNFGENSTFTLNGKNAWIYGGIGGTGGIINLNLKNNLTVGKIIPTNPKLTITADTLKVNEEVKIKVIDNKFSTSIMADTVVCAKEVSFIWGDKQERPPVGVAPIKIGPKPDSGKKEKTLLNLWFQGNYVQRVPVTISGGNQVAFGKDYGNAFSITADDSDLEIDSKVISFYCEIIKKSSAISYKNLSKSIDPTNPTNPIGTIILNINRDIEKGIIGSPSDIKNGQYLTTKGSDFSGLSIIKPSDVCPKVSETIPFKIPKGPDVDKPVGIKDETGNVEEVTTEYLLENSTS